MRPEAAGQSLRKHMWIAVLLAVGASGCAVESAPMPPDGHVFLTIKVMQTGDTGIQDCVVRLDPLYSESPGPKAAAGISNADGIVKFVQPHGDYQMFIECPGEEPREPTYIELDGGVAYASAEV